MKLPPFTRSLLRQVMLLALPTSVALAGPVEQSGKSLPKDVEPVMAGGHPMYLGTFNTGIKTSDVYTEGNVSFVVPLWSSYGADGTLGGGQVFLAPYASLGEQGELATSLGLGWRYLFNNQSIDALKSDQRAGFMTEGFYIGANVFVDNLRTQFDNDFWQLGIGAEIGTRYLEVRGNYYIPFDGGRKLAQRTTSTERFRDSSSSTRFETTGTPLSEFNASGHTLGHDVDLTTTAITTTRTTTTTVRTIASLYEEGMEGWDVEAAFLIPGLDQYLDVSLLAGYYSFDNQPFGPQNGGSGKTEGFKAGIEIRPVPAIVLTGMWYEDEGLTGSDWVAGIGLQIPLGKDWQDAFKPRRRHLLERMAEPVARQNAAVKVARDVDTDREVSQTTSTAVRRRVVARDQRRIVIYDDIVFVNNGGEVGQGLQAGSAAGDGTAENPVNTIQAGADVAATKNSDTQRVWHVYTQGGFGTYNESVTITGSTDFIASNQIFTSTITGENFGTGDRAVVQGGFVGDVTNFVAGHTTPSFVGMSGYDISGGFGGGNGLQLLGVEQISIIDNSFAGTAADAISINNVANLEVEIRDNQINGTNNGRGIAIGDVNYGGIVTVGNLTGNIVNNDVNGTNDHGIHIVLDNDFNGNIADNDTSGNNIDNIGNPGPQGGLAVQIGGTFAGDVTDNTSNDSNGHGIYLSANAFEGDFTGNTANENTTIGPSIGNGIQLVIASDFTGNFADNTANENQNNGVVFDVNGNFTGDFSDNTAEENSGNGIVMTVDGTITGDVFGNTVDGAGATDGSNVGITHGFILQAGNFMGDFRNNTISRAEDTGLEMTIAGNFTGDIYENTANNNNLDDVVAEQGGMIIAVNGIFAGSVLDNTTNNNATVGTQGVGLSFTANTFDASMGSFSGNTANNNGTTGIFTNVTNIANGPVVNPEANEATGNGTTNIQEVGDAVAVP